MSLFYISGQKQAVEDLDLSDIDISTVTHSEATRIGNRLGVRPGSVNPEQLRKGVETEYEHTSDPGEAGRIALDHLRELPNYYTRLKKMEGTKTAKTLRNFQGFPALAYEPPFVLQKPIEARRTSHGGYTTTGTTINPKVAAFPTALVARELAEELVEMLPRLLRRNQLPPGERKKK